MSNVEYVSRNKNIDFLRAVAILLVMVVHFPRLRQFLPLLNPWSGVDLFFAISGFVVATSFVPQVDIALDKSSDCREKSVAFVRHAKAFFVRRFMRIMPALVFALSFYISLGLLIKEPTLGSFYGITPELFAIFTYTANFFAGYSGTSVLGWHWSLAAEEQFYFIFPFFIVICRSWRSRVWLSLIGLAVMTFVLRPYGTTWFGSPPALMYLPQFRNDAIGYGFLIFAASRQPWFNILSPSVIASNSWFLLPTILILIFIIALAPQLALNYSVAVPTIGMASAALLYLAVSTELPFIKLKPLESIFAWIGLRSYGLYLLHIPIVRLTQHIETLISSPDHTIGYKAHFVIVIASLTAIVEFSYRFIEMPTMQLGRKWSREILKIS